MEGPYRTGYGVEVTERPLQPREEVLRAEARRRERAPIREAEMQDSFVLLGIGAVVTAAACWVGFRVGLTWGLLVFLVGALAVGMLGLGRRRKELPWPWSMDDEEWRVHDVVIRARSVVYAVEDMNYEPWLLFENPGGPWVALAIERLPSGIRPTQLEMSEVRITLHRPTGWLLELSAKGVPLPRAGAVAFAHHHEVSMFDEAMARQQTWDDHLDDRQAEEMCDSPIMLLEEATVPEWARKAAADVSG